MKKILILLIAFVLFTACNTKEKNTIEALARTLEIVRTSTEEELILTSLWRIAYEEEGISMGVRAVDAEGNSVINNLSKGIEPIVVTITFSDGLWSEVVEFTPLTLENVYILLNE